ncbi:hypothetical protein HK102_009794 [Quaeritorhiza haematococci]|nr:hypothetical protein HK102_009794 [Quaeritorhiza haematococci]
MGQHELTPEEPEFLAAKFADHCCIAPEVVLAAGITSEGSFPLEAPATIPEPVELAADSEKTHETNPPTTDQEAVAPSVQPPVLETPPLKIAFWDIGKVTRALQKIKSQYFDYRGTLEPKHLITKLLRDEDLSILYIRHRRAKSEKHPSRYSDAPAFYRYTHSMSWAPKPPLNVILYVRRPLYVMFLPNASVIPSSGYRDGFYWGNGVFCHGEYLFGPEQTVGPAGWEAVPLWSGWPKHRNAIPKVYVPPQPGDEVKGKNSRRKATESTTSSTPESPKEEALATAPAV